MKMPARLVALAACLALSPLPGLGQATPTPAKPAADGPEVRELVLSPAAAPVPALKYRLLPVSADLRPGDAAPVYLRLRHERKDFSLQPITDHAADWLAKPWAEFPRDEARKLVAGYALALEQVEFGTNRRDCDWAYTVDEQREKAFEILLPDVADMRSYWGRLLHLRMRVEIADARFDDAVRTGRVGLAFARHVARGPFLLNNLVGVAIAEGIVDRLEELLAQPSAPNLYWALTALPDPPVSVRDGLEFEQRLGENLVPELGDDEHPRSDAEWAVDLARLHGHLVRLTRTLRAYDAANGLKPSAEGGIAEDLSTFRVALLGSARTQFPAGSIGDDQAAFRHAVGQYWSIRDDYFKGAYLPAPSALSVLDASQSRSRLAKPGPLGIFTQILSNVSGGVHAEARLARRVAALRVIEALRLHAQDTGAGLPATLDAVKVVPIPLDPGTGRPFDYRRDGDAAVLTVRPLPGSGRPNVSYRITLRR